MPRVVREALFLAYRGPNGDGTAQYKPEKSARVYDFPVGTTEFSGMQRRMTIAEGDECFMGYEEDVIELFASSADAHTIPDDKDSKAQWHT